MTSLVGNAASPVKDGTSSLPRRQSSFTRPPLRALYDLLVAPMEGVSAWPAPWCQDASLPTQHPMPLPPDTEQAPATVGVFQTWGFSASL